MTYIPKMGIQGILDTEGFILKSEGFLLFRMQGKHMPCVKQAKFVNSEAHCFGTLRNLLHI